MLIQGARNPAAATRIVAFPHAGGGATSFARLRTAMAEVELLAVQLPGRENRMSEPPVTDMASFLRLIDGAAALFDECPYRLLGHSLGARLAYFAAARLSELGVRPPDGLILSAGAPPCRTDAENSRGRPVYELPDAELMKRMEAYGGMPVLADGDMRALLLPKLRADLRLLHDGDKLETPVLDLPFMLLGGRNDGSTPRARMAAWSKLTSGPVSIHILPGGHFFLYEQPFAAVPLILGGIKGRAPALLTEGDDLGRHAV